MTKDVTHTLSLKESSAEVNGLERSCSLFYHSTDRMRDFHAYHVIFTHPPRGRRHPTWLGVIEPQQQTTE